MNRSSSERDSLLGSQNLKPSLLHPRFTSLNLRNARDLGQTSFFKATLNLLIGAFGTGLVFLPFSCYVLGIFNFLALVCCCGILSHQNCLMVSEAADMCLAVDPRHPPTELSDITRIAAETQLGPESRWPSRLESTVRWVNTFDMLVTALAKLTLYVEGFRQILGALGWFTSDFLVDLICILSCFLLLAYPISLNEYAFIGKISWIGVLAMVSLALSIIGVSTHYAVIHGPAWPPDTWLPQAPKGGVSALGMPFSTCVFSYAIASTFFLVKADMKRPELVTMSNTIVHVVSTLVFCLVGVLIYLMIGKTTDEVYNDPRFEQGGFFFWYLISGIVSSYPAFIFFITPVLQNFESLIFVPSQVATAKSQGMLGVLSFRCGFLVVILLASLLLAKYNLFPVVQAASGAYLVTITCFFTPSLVFWSLYTRQTQYKLPTVIYLWRILVSLSSLFVIVCCFRLGTLDLRQTIGEKLEL